MADAPKPRLAGAVARVVTAGHAAGGPLTRWRLKDTKVIGGKNLAGRQSNLTFYRAEVNGWHWHQSNWESCVPITSALALTEKNHLTLNHEDGLLGFWGPIGALRWTGLDGVIVTADHSDPPFFGRSKELKYFLEAGCERTTEKLPWFTVRRAVRFFDPAQPARFVEIKPHPLAKPPELKVTTQINHPKLGPHTYEAILDESVLQSAFESFEPGTNYRLSKFKPKFLWPHHNRFTWVQNHPAEKAKQLLCENRLSLLLGALSLFSHDSLLAGHVTSNCAGPAEDLGFLTKLAQTPDIFVEVPLADAATGGGAAAAQAS